MAMEQILHCVQDDRGLGGWMTRVDHDDKGLGGGMTFCQSEGKRIGMKGHR